MKIIVKFKEVIIKEFVSDKSSITLGRDPKNEIVIDNLAVSRFHTKIYQHEWPVKHYIVEDLNSGNGTFLNNKKITKEILHDQDTILIGKHTLVFINDTEPPVQETAKADVPLGEETYILSSSLASALGLPEGVAGASVDILSGETSQASIKLTQPTTMAGKNPKADIKIRGLFVGDVAFTIQKTSTGFTLTPAAGRRVTRVNGKAVQGSQELQDGDVITVGATKLQFRYHPAEV